MRAAGFGAFDNFLRVMEFVLSELITSHALFAIAVCACDDHFAAGAKVFRGSRLVGCFYLVRLALADTVSGSMTTAPQPPDGHFAFVHD